MPSVHSPTSVVSDHEEWASCSYGLATLFTSGFSSLASLTSASATRLSTYAQARHFLHQELVQHPSSSAASAQFGCPLPGFYWLPTQMYGCACICLCGPQIRRECILFNIRMYKVYVCTLVHTYVPRYIHWPQKSLVDVYVCFHLLSHQLVNMCAFVCLSCVYSNVCMYIRIHMCTCICVCL